MPAIGVSSIGAGGGSIAWRDPAGALKVGPRSAGADPGPACYGRGSQATLTDAFLLCGLLSPKNFVGGRLPLVPEAAEAAMRPLAAALGLDVDRAAEAVIEVATANMYAAFSNVLARHGVDPRDMSLVAFGGAGPLQACVLAAEFHIPRVVVPPAPGTLCALGAMVADVRRDDVRTLHRSLGTLTLAELRAACDELEARARQWLREDAPPVGSSLLGYSADLRYVGQAFEIEVPLEPAWLGDGGLDRLRGAFHDLHERLFAHADREADVELIDLRATLIGTTPKPPLRELGRATAPVQPVARRPIHYRGERYLAAVYRRGDLQAGHALDGPAIVEQDDTTTLLPAGFRGEVDRLGNLVIRAR